jgi:hypothetical protein
MAMRPIQTVYRGYKFRSRLEARWAVFFDALKIKWEYEPEGYHLSNGEMYLPDFYLPDLCMCDYETKESKTQRSSFYVEVKPERDVDAKARQLAVDANTKVLMACGVPSATSYPVIFEDGSVRNASFSSDFAVSNYALDSGLVLNEMFLNDDGSIDEGFLTKETLAAIVRARSARFEHGEKGATL